MFSKLIDSVDAYMWGNTRLRWEKIVDTFLLKYPSIQVYSNYSKTIPAAFLVWRSLDGHYVVELFPSKDEMLNLIRYLHNQWFGHLVTEPWKNRSSMNPDSFTKKNIVDAKGHILNWGLFSYECRPGVGEFAANNIGSGVNFLNTFILEGDRHMFVKNKN